MGRRVRGRRTLRSRGPRGVANDDSSDSIDHLFLLLLSRGRKRRILDPRGNVLHNPRRRDFFTPRVGRSRRLDARLFL